MEFSVTKITLILHTILSVRLYREKRSDICVSDGRETFSAESQLWDCAVEVEVKLEGANMLIELQDVEAHINPS